MNDLELDELIAAANSAAQNAELLVGIVILDRAEPVWIRQMTRSDTMVILADDAGGTHTFEASSVMGKLTKPRPKPYNISAWGD
jgi:hypothetical protein